MCQCLVKKISIESWQITEIFWYYFILYGKFSLAMKLAISKLVRSFLIRVTKLLIVFSVADVRICSVLPSVRPSVCSFVCTYETTQTQFKGVL